MKKLNLLKTRLNEKGYSAYIVPGTDPHGSEYLPAIWQRRQFITGFTGSSGDCVISNSECGLWTDSRYYLQAEEQLAESGFTLFRQGIAGVPDISEWLCSQFSFSHRVALDPQLVSIQKAEELQQKLSQSNIELIFDSENLIDNIWENRPSFPEKPVFILSDEIAGKNADQKLKYLRQQLSNMESDLIILSSLDSIAWLTNLRGSDIPYNPLFISYAVVSETTAKIYIGPTQVPDHVKNARKDVWDFGNYFDFEKDLISISGKRVWLDKGKNSYWIYLLIKNNNSILFEKNPVEYYKALKSETEIKNMIKAHTIDGSAVTKFLCWLQKESSTNGVTELSAAKKLEEFRRQAKAYQNDSFHPISAFGPHGAIVHYSHTKESSIPITENGLYLIDSGAHYLFGTTDITRTIAIGQASSEQKEMYTRVLKGFIHLITTSFPQGTSGSQLDVLARQYLWEIGLDYGHGTGHGVGYFLNVHEGPQAISPSRGWDTPLKPFMVCSIEPGFYKTGEYGIRIENLVYVDVDKELSSDSNLFYCFKNLTQCPFDSNLIDSKWLTAFEIDFINQYHQQVKINLEKYLNAHENEWLEKIIRPIEC
ncbi:MAG: aminopeptidase P family protein [Spirochaetales bacterium]|nr:aminopeptidase P family protein [Spirochaetales bacterium]